jgi:hypothetical protein
MKEVHVTVKDTEKRMATVIVQGCKDRNTALAIVEFIDKYSAAGVIQWAYVERETYDGTPQEGKYNSVDQQNLLLFTDEEGFQVRFVLPAPGDETFDELQEPTEDFAGAVQEVLNTNTDLLPLLYKGGGLTANIDLP